jgi:hypothetical protein
MTVLAQATSPVCGTPHLKARDRFPKAVAKKGNQEEKNTNRRKFESP